MEKTEKQESQHDQKKNLFQRMEAWTLEQKLYVFATILILLSLFAVKQTLLPTSTPSYHTYTITEKQNHATIHMHINDTLTLQLQLLKSSNPQILVSPNTFLATTQPFGLTNNRYQTTLQAIQPGTATLSVTTRPQCTKGHMCPLVIIQNFGLQVIVDQ